MTEVEAFLQDLYDRRLILPNPPLGNDVAGKKAFCPTGPGGGVDNSCSPKIGLLQTAINKLSSDDVPELDWSHVSDLARWDNSSYTAALVDRAYQPTNEEILEEAQLNYSRHTHAVDDDAHLKDRIRSVMTDAAAHLVHLHAIELKDQDEKDASDKWWATKERISQAVATAEDALDVTFQEARSGSAYANYDAGDVSLKLRISDHYQRPGGGFNEGRGERMGEADVEWVVGLDDPLPTKMDYRRDVAIKLRELRE